MTGCASISVCLVWIVFFRCLRRACNILPFNMRRNLERRQVFMCTRAEPFQINPESGSEDEPFASGKHPQLGHWEFRTRSNLDGNIHYHGARALQGDDLTRIVRENVGKQVLAAGERGLPFSALSEPGVLLSLRDVFTDL
jgi:hypothetical protein